MTATRILNRRTIVILAAVGTLLFAATAFTASVTTTDVTETAGYGQVSVSGATLSSLDFTTNAAGDTITDAALVFGTDQTGNTVTINFDGLTTSGTCTVSTTTPTEVDCDTLAQPTVDADTVGISVTNNA